MITYCTTDDEQHAVKREGSHLREVTISLTNPNGDYNTEDELNMRSKKITSFIMGVKEYIKKPVNYNMVRELHRAKRKMQLSFIAD